MAQCHILVLAAAAIGFDHTLVGAHLGHRALGQQPPAGHHKNLVAQPGNIVQVVFDQAEGDISRLC